MDITDWAKQLKKGSLEYCILLLIKEKPYYGYEIMNELSAWPIITTKESTIYPLLKRLEKDGSVETSWQPSAEGLPPRKYYSINEAGMKHLEEMTREWDNLSSAIDDIRKGMEAR